MLVEIDGVTLHLAHPDELTVTFRGQAGGVRLQVADEDAEAALTILAGAKS